MTPPHQPPTLSQALGFDPADVQANQNGTLTHAQRARLRRRRLSDNLLPISGITASALLVILVIPNGLLNMTSLLLSLALTITGIILTWRFLRQITQTIQKINTTLKDNTVATQTGPIWRRQQQKSFTQIIYTVGIDDQRFHVRLATFKAFQDGARYHIHYAPKTHLILSAEFIAAP